MSISARDAKKMTDKRIEELKEKQIEDVFILIKNAIANGEYQIEFVSNLYDETEELLEQLGYTVDYYNCRTTVSWDLEDE